ncbi:MAG: NAD-dependent epimerase/dehydratase family protein [Luteolibacter sp.]
MIRWIDDKLGTAAFEDPATDGYAKLDVRGLVDGPANKPDALVERIETGLAMLAESGQLIVCCEFGISRSNTIASAILARRDGLPFDEAAARVRQQVGELRMDYGFVQTVRNTIEPDPLPPLNPRRVIVTGGTGFLGKWLERIAGDSLELVLLGSKDIDIAASPFELDAAVRKHRPATIIHLATPRVRHTHEVVGQSVAMLRNVADVCGQHDIFLVYASSCVVFSGRKNEGEHTAGDDEIPQPYGNYAMAKALCEQMVGYLRQGGKLRSSMLRLTHIYGPGSTLPPFLFRTAENSRAGKPLVTHRYRNGRPKLQFLHVRDAALALLAAAERRIEGTFNIGGTEALSTRDLVKLIAEVLDSPSESQEVELEAAVANVVLDISKAREQLGWSPSIGLREGFTDLFVTSPASITLS